MPVLHDWPQITSKALMECPAGDHYRKLKPVRTAEGNSCRGDLDRTCRPGLPEWIGPTDLRPRKSAPLSPDAGVQQVPQAVAQQVESQHRYENGSSRQ